MEFYDIRGTVCVATGRNFITMKRISRIKLLGEPSAFPANALDRGKEFTSSIH